MEREMRNYDQLLAEDIQEYIGGYGDLIFYAPAYFRMLAGMLEDPLLPKQYRQLVLSAIAYFVLPNDVVRDGREGPLGYADDLFLAAFVADHVYEAAGDEALLSANWDAERAVLDVTRDILAREAELVGDRKGTMLQFIGYGE